MLFSTSTSEVLSPPPARQPSRCVKFVSVAYGKWEIDPSRSVTWKYDLQCPDQPTPKPKSSLRDGFEANFEHWQALHSPSSLTRFVGGARFRVQPSEVRGVGDREDR